MKQQTITPPISGELSESAAETYKLLSDHLMKCIEESEKLYEDRRTIHKRMDYLYHEKERVRSLLDKWAQYCEGEEEEREEGNGTI
jgi:hypothetical protein